MKTFEEYRYRFSIPHNKAKLGYKYSPKSKDELMEAIEAEIELQGPKANLNCIDTSKITDMSHLFNKDETRYAENFSGDISNWNVNNVDNMSCMFWGAKNFNGDISGWDVGNVKYMVNMFAFAKSFNQDISGWDVSNVDDMSGMFDTAKNFNQDISKWDISNVSDMCHMFCHAEKFNQDLSKWDVSNVKYYDMFYKCPIKEEYKPKFN